MNHQAANLDKLHIVGAGTGPKNVKPPATGEPFLVTGGNVSHSDSLGRYHPLIAASHAKLDELVGEFDRWLKGGADGTRNDFLKNLEHVEVSGLGH
jgi:hypothetical protein